MEVGRKRGEGKRKEEEEKEEKELSKGREEKRRIISKQT